MLPPLTLLKNSSRTHRKGRSMTRLVLSQSIVPTWSCRGRKPRRPRPGAVAATQMSSDFRWPKGTWRVRPSFRKANSLARTTTTRPSAPSISGGRNCGVMRRRLNAHGSRTARRPTAALLAGKPAELTQTSPIAFRRSAISRHSTSDNTTHPSQETSEELAEGFAR